MRQRRQRRGNYSLFMGVFATTIVGFGALGVDLSYIAMTSSQAQAVADAASHAALIAYRTSEARSTSARVAAGQAAAQYYVDSNEVGLGTHGDLDDVVFGIFNPDTGRFSAGAQPYNAVQTTVSRDGGNGLQLFFAPILGHEVAHVSQRGVTAANPREILVVVDRSCSMQSPRSDPGWEGVRDALTVFGRYMVDHQVPKDRLGITTFNTRGDVWDPLRYVDGNEASILSKWSSWGSCGRHPRYWWTYYGYACSGGTNQAAGIAPAVQLLTGSGNELAFKAIIVVSDGNPSSSGYRSAFLSAAEDAWAEDIHVWTVGFGASINDGLMQAATKGVGTYYRLPTSDGLEGVMLDIARSIPVTIAD